MREKPGYRDVPYGINPLGAGVWEWVYYPKKAVGDRRSGQVRGGQRDAVMACQKAIDAFLDEDSN
jgi:hypothetical protein